MTNYIPKSKRRENSVSSEMQRIYQPNLEVIACVFKPGGRSEGKWTCLSLAETPDGRWEILETSGEKVVGTGSRLNKEFVGFNPEDGKITWIARHRDSIVKSLCEDIMSLVETGQTRWTRKFPEK